MEREIITCRRSVKHHCPTMVRTRAKRRPYWCEFPLTITKTSSGGAAPVPTSEGIEGRRAAAADSASTLPALRAGNHLAHFIGRQGDVSDRLISFMRLRARSRSPCGVFWVFLATTLQFPWEARPCQSELPRCFMVAGPNGAYLSAESGLYHKALK
jgi:hypothetical protein